MCTFNGQPYVIEQVRSILRQSVTPRELVVADDGSSDGTLEAVKRGFELEAPRHRLPDLVILPAMRAPLGVARNFERAMRACKSPLIALADQDDIWLPEKLQRQSDALELDKTASLVASNAGLIGQRRGAHADLFGALRVSPAELRLLSSRRAFEAAVRRNVLPGMTFLMRRGLLNSALPIPEGWAHDSWLALQAALSGELRVLPDRLVNYRQHGANQIGAPQSSLKARARRMLAGAADVEEVADRYALALDRAISSSITVAAFRTLQGKARFERDRAELPLEPARRLARLARLVATGAYSRFASNGSLNAIRDMASLWAREEVL